MKMACTSENGLESALLALILRINLVGWILFICEAHVMLG